MRALLLLLLVGCSADPCESFSGQTCISLEVRGPFTIDQLLVSASGAFHLETTPAPDQPRATAVELPVALAVLPGEVSGDFTLSVLAQRERMNVAAAIGGGVLTAGQNLSVVMDLTSLLTDEPDLAGAPDLPKPTDLAKPIDLAKADLAGALCDTVTQSPCPSGQKCVHSGSLQVCVPDGNKIVAQSCTTDPQDNCARGNQCLFPGDFDPTAGICEQFCGKEADCTQPAVSVGGTLLANNRAHCLFPFGGAGRTELCSLACNPVSSRGASGCPSGSVCVYASNASFAELTFCDRGGTGTDGQACNASFRCAPGFNCLTVGSNMICRAMCRAGTNGDCSSPLVCKPGAGGSPPMFGYCCPSSGC